MIKSYSINENVIVKGKSGQTFKITNATPDNRDRLRVRDSFGNSFQVSRSSVRTANMIDIRIIDSIKALTKLARF